MAAEEIEQVEDFDAFWATQRGKQPRARIRGALVPIPMDLPLALVAQMHGATPADEEQNKELLGELYGADTIEQWVRDGMGAREFFVVLTWSFVRGTGGTITFEEATARADEVLAAMGEDGQGKAVPAGNRKARRSAGAGGSSSRTSAASTASRRKK